MPRTKEQLLGASGTWNTKVVKCFVRLDIGVMRYMLKKQHDEGEKGETITSLLHVSTRFVDETLVELPHEANRDSFEAMLTVKETAPAPKSAGRP